MSDDEERCASCMARFNCTNYGWREPPCEMVEEDEDDETPEDEA